ncbi:KTSC domain-containing protein [Hyphomicrobium sp. 1Nfss2.1]|uniref:hypothetical protein n=1 Tax=Hyphomicrobium sp. 1Nfss2.1 TaxID=3413936 RepID=UPI003C7C2BE6
MSAVAEVAVADKPEIKVKPEIQAAPDAKSQDVLLHVRYSPDASIFFIDSCPPCLGSDDWLKLLLAEASDCYRALAGGRGFFRIPSERFSAILVKAAN